MNKKDRNRFIKSLPQNNLVFLPIKENLEKAQPLFENIIITWKEHHENDISDYLERKKEDVKTGKIQGFLAVENNVPVGLCWLEVSSAKYGTVMLFAPLKDHQVLLAVKLVRSKLMDGRVVELVAFHDSAEYIRGFLGMGFREKLRRRMGIYKEEFAVTNEIPANLTFVPAAEEHLDILADISYVAHKARTELEGYIDYSTLEYCKNHKKKIVTGEFGKFVPKSSLLMFYHGKPAGSCVCVDINYWGFDHMLWIFDFIIRPEYQGYGFGKILLQQVLKNAFELDYRMVGLSVTVSNERAKNLYEKTGFLGYEDYYEIISPDALK